MQRCETCKSSLSLKNLHARFWLKRAIHKAMRGGCQQEGADTITGTEEVKSQRWDTSLLAYWWLREAFWRSWTLGLGFGKDNGRGEWEPSEQRGEARRCGRRG